MEPALRGILEKVIDDELHEDKLESNYRIFMNFKNRGFIESVPAINILMYCIHKLLL